MQAQQLLGQLWQTLGAASVHGNGHFFIAVVALEFDKRLQQLGWQIVHAVIASILQRMQCNGFARAGHAADQHKLHRHDFKLL